MQTYTPPGGYSQPAQQQQSFQTALQTAQAPAVPPEQQAATMQAQKPQFLQQQQQQLGQQAGLPQMAGNYADEAKMMQLFAHDQNLSKQFTRPDMQVMGAQTQNQGAPTAGNVGAPQAPVLTQQNLDQGFQGFATPGAQNAGIALGGNQITGNLDLINKALQYQAGQVQSQVGSSGQAYQAAIDGLLRLAQLQKEQKANTPNPGEVFDKIIQQVQSDNGGRATEKDIWDYINLHDQALREQGVDVQDLWNLHEGLAGKVGKGGVVTAGKMTGPKAKITKGQVEGYTLPDGRFIATPPPSIIDNVLGKTKPTLIDPDGNIHQYDTVSDPEYVNDLASNWAVGGYSE